MYRYKPTLKKADIIARLGSIEHQVYFKTFWISTSSIFLSLWIIRIDEIIYTLYEGAMNFFSNLSILDKHKVEIKINPFE